MEGAWENWVKQLKLLSNESCILPDCFFFLTSLIDTSANAFPNGSSTPTKLLSRLSGCCFCSDNGDMSVFNEDSVLQVVIDGHLLVPRPIAPPCMEHLKVKRKLFAALFFGQLMGGFVFGWPSYLTFRRSLCVGGTSVLAVAGGSTCGQRAADAQSRPMCGIIHAGSRWFFLLLTCVPLIFSLISFILFADLF